MNKIEVSGGSDDLVFLRIMEDNVVVYDDEHGRSHNKFNVNGHFTIHIVHSVIPKTGWVVGIEVEEDALRPEEFAKIYNISMTMDENGYSPLLTVQTHQPISIEGYYGDNISKVKQAFEYSHLSDEDIDYVIATLKKNDLLK